MVMLRYAQALLALSLFLLATSGWVLHSHYCPISERQSISLTDFAQCPVNTAPVEQESSCCQKPEMPSKPVCAEDMHCCEDEWVVLDIYSPFSAPVVLELSLQTAPLADAFVHPSLLLSSSQRNSASAVPEPPPPVPLYSRSLDRLNAFQVYRT